MIKFILLGLLMYAVMLAFLYATQRHHIFIPDRSRPDPAAYGAANMTVVTVRTDDGLTLEGWYSVPAPGKPVILLFHGNAGNIGIRAFKAQAFIADGYGVLMAGYRGYGGNDGIPSEDGFYRDGRAWLSFLESSGVPVERIVLYGESIGTGTAVQMAAERQGFKALVLEMPFTSLTDVAAIHMFYVPVRWLLKYRFDNLSKIRDIRVPLLILHGQADMVVPYAQGRRLFEAANEPKSFVSFPLGGHNDLYNHGAAQAIGDFFKGLEK